VKLTIKVPDFSMTKGELPPDVVAGGRARHLGKRLRSLAGWGALGLLFFVVFGWLAIPTKAIAWRIGHEARKAGYSIDVADVSIYPWGSATLHDVTWTYEPSRPDTPPLNYYMEEVDVDISLLSLMMGELDVEVEHERGEDGTEGRYYANYVRNGSESSIKIQVEELPLYDVPKASQAMGVPLTGLVRLDVEIEMPENEFAQAIGHIEVECSACTAGDGEAKLFIPGAKGSLSKDGLTIPEIDLGTLVGVLEVADGQAVIQDAITTESKDLTMSLTGSLDLKDPFGKSWFNMVLKVALTEELLESSERVRFMYSSASEKSRLKEPEKGLGFKLQGPVARPKFIGINEKSRRERVAERRKRQRERAARRRSRTSKTSSKKAPVFNKDDDKKAGDKNDDEDDKKDDADDKKDDEDASDDKPPLNIEPIDADDGPDEPESDEGGDQPALPPSDDEEVEVFDPNEPPPEGDPNEQPAEGQDGGPEQGGGSGGQQGGQ
jgi:type II secretion system protein N